jgi:Response regulator containing a CheY-like receiver domain and an HTH DNA-binding domain
MPRKVEIIQELSVNIRPGLGAILSALAFLLIAALIAFDLFADGGEGVGLAHLLIEGGAFAVALFASVSTLIHYFDIRRSLKTARLEASRWRDEHRELIAGLSKAIGMQFKSWDLTSAETEVGYLLLKGFSLRDIARLRETSERTVREQARAIYRKAGLTGRAELSAFFLEDLLLGDAA